jgi:hypothetical protein
MGGKISSLHGTATGDKTERGGGMAHMEAIHQVRTRTCRSEFAKACARSDVRHGHGRHHPDALPKRR